MRSFFTNLFRVTITRFILNLPKFIEYCGGTTGWTCEDISEYKTINRGKAVSFLQGSDVVSGKLEEK